MTVKLRLSASVDADLLEAAEAAAARGEVATLSSWVNDALRMKLEHDQRLRALGTFISSYEAEHGVITPEEVAAAQRRMQARAVRIRRPAGPSGRRKRAG